MKVYINNIVLRQKKRHAINYKLNKKKEKIKTE